MRAQFVRHGNSKRGLGVGHSNKEVLAKSLEEYLIDHGIVFQQYPEYSEERDDIRFETESIHFVSHYTDKFLRELKIDAKVEMTGFSSYPRDATFVIRFKDES